MQKNTVEYKRFVWELNNIMKLNNNKKIVFLCIGTTEVVGDSFGPKVGTILKQNLKINDKVEIIGDMKNALTYEELNKSIKFIKNKYTNEFVIALDSALSNKSNVGKIFIQNRGLRYAESLKKKNTSVGNISIKAVVGENSYDNIQNFKNLKNVTHKQIKLLSEIVSKGILNVMNKKENNGKNIYK